MKKTQKSVTRDKDTLMVKVMSALLEKNVMQKYKRFNDYYLRVNFN